MVDARTMRRLEQLERLTAELLNEKTKLKERVTILERKVDDLEWKASGHVE